MADVPEIVVGVDRSEGSRTALAHALRDAARRSARVRAVLVFERPEYWSRPYGLAAPPPVGELAARAERGLRATVDEVVASVGGAAARVPVEVAVYPGAPAVVLVEQAEQADELVVGHRGRGGIASALLGSVSLQCALHASCRVTVVRPECGKHSGSVRSDLTTNVR